MNLELKDISFCDTSVQNICSSAYKKKILDDINSIDSNIMQTPILKESDKDNLDSIKKNEHLLSVHSNGNSYYLYLFKDRYNVCTMIDHKKIQGYHFPRMMVVPFRFDDFVYNGTLLRGELIKNNKNKWIFLLNDILIYNNKSIIKKPFIERLGMIYNILNNFYKVDFWCDPCILKIKCFYSYSEINRFIQNHVKKIDYPTNGIMCTPIHDYDTSIFIPYSSEQTSTKSSNHTKKINGIHILNHGDIHVFKIKKTKNSGIYNLYCMKKNNLVKHSIARVPSLETSDFLKKLCIDTELYYCVQCKYDSVFNKWIPLQEMPNDSEIIDILQIIK